MSWYVAPCLVRLEQQLDETFPRRSRASDGTRGDAAHAARTSDHNPDRTSKPPGEVRAKDVTHDPRNGPDCNHLANELVASRDYRIKYVIWRRRIWQPRTGWSAYGGENPHDKHLHLSVTEGGAKDFGPWALPMLNAAPPPPAAAPAPVVPPPYFPPNLNPEDPMLVRNTTTGEVWMLWADGSRQGVPNPEYLGVLVEMYGQPREYANPRAWDLVMSFHRLVR